MSFILRLIPALIPLVAVGCAMSYETPPFGVPVAPESFRERPAMPHPADNPPTPEKIALGRSLFFETRLSGDGTAACASCHLPEKGWADGLKTARGEGGRTLRRNTPTIINSGYAPGLFWDGRSPSLEDQALKPVMSGGELARHPAILADRIAADPAYRARFEAAFPGEGVTETGIARALAAFERSIVSGETPFDRHLAGDAAALSPSARRGFALFVGKAQCAACHQGWLLSDGKFHDIGLPDDDFGRGGITNNRFLDHAFRTPSLREIGRTAPYMHDGSLPTLAAVVDHYADGVAPRRGTPPRVALTPAERADLVAFLQSLDSTSGPA
jgi:cytochrome c peroxidase